MIDGYNLMHVTRFKPNNTEVGELRRCREGLLSLLAAELPANQYREITIVFDSDQAPKNLPDHQQWRHLAVVFARNENSADDLIAKLVQSHPHPRKLIVISSDHRVQNAATRRKATPLDSDAWFDAVLEYEPPEEHFESQNDAKLDEQQLAEFREAMKAPIPLPPQDEEVKREVEEFENPFPEGYFDDLDDAE